MSTVIVPVTLQDGKKTTVSVDSDLWHFCMIKVRLDHDVEEVPDCDKYLKHQIKERFKSGDVCNSSTLNYKLLVDLLDNTIFDFHMKQAKADKRRARSRRQFTEEQLELWIK